MSAKSTLLDKSRAFDAQNIAAAKIIVAKPEKHLGIQLEWAKAVLAKHEKQGEAK
jgi:hypothetical protein